MTPFEQQMSAVKEAHPAASSQATPDGAIVVTVPEVPLPDGWNATTTSVRFIAPVGYPISRPDCFWADSGLRLKNGQPPQNTGSNPIPGDSSPYLWFSWHVQSWSPNADTLTTYLNVIRKRFQEVR